jgi:hypothetical protein
MLTLYKRLIYWCLITVITNYLNTNNLKPLVFSEDYLIIQAAESHCNYRLGQELRPSTAFKNQSFIATIKPIIKKMAALKGSHLGTLTLSK